MVRKIFFGIILGFVFSLFFSHTAVLAEDNNSGPITAEDQISGDKPFVPWKKPPKGKAKGAAAIASDGSVLGCSKCDPADTFRIGTGVYQVAWKFSDVRAAAGYGRIVQPDTLDIFSLPATSCITADRSLALNAVWVECFDANGANLDTSFMIILTK